MINKAYYSCGYFHEIEGCAIFLRYKICKRKPVWGMDGNVSCTKYLIYIGSTMVMVAKCVRECSAELGKSGPFSLAISSFWRNSMHGLQVLLPLRVSRSQVCSARYWEYRKLELLSLQTYRRTQTLLSNDCILLYL